MRLHYTIYLKFASNHDLNAKKWTEPSFIKMIHSSFFLFFIFTQHLKPTINGFTLRGS